MAHRLGTTSRKALIEEPYAKLEGPHERKMKGDNAVYRGAISFERRARKPHRNCFHVTASIHARTTNMKSVGLTPKTDALVWFDSFQSHGSSTMHNISKSMIEEPYAKLEGAHEGKMNDGARGLSVAVLRRFVQQSVVRSAYRVRCLMAWPYAGRAGVSGQELTVRSCAGLLRWDSMGDAAIAVTLFKPRRSTSH
jgi:hypothetical protein